MIAQSESWRLIFITSGGFAGEELHLEISSDGWAVARDVCSGLETEEKLAEAELEPIAQELKALNELPDPARPERCADCIAYLLDWTLEGKRRRVVLNDLSLPSSGFEAFIGELKKVRDRLLTAGTPVE